MAQGIVDFLEPVEVDRDERETLAAALLCAGQGSAQCVAECEAVPQAGQHIVSGHSQIIFVRAVEFDDLGVGGLAEREGHYDQCAERRGIAAAVGDRVRQARRQHGKAGRDHLKHEQTHSTRTAGDVGDRESRAGGQGQGLRAGRNGLHHQRIAGQSQHDRVERRPERKRGIIGQRRRAAVGAARIPSVAMKQMEPSGAHQYVGDRIGDEDALVGHRPRKAGH